MMSHTCKNKKCINGGYCWSNTKDSIKIDDEPYLKFYLCFGGEYVTTVSQLKAEGYKLVDGDLRCASSYPSKSKVEPITYYDLWNYGCVWGYGCDDESEELARKWYNSKVRAEKPDFKGV